LVYQTSTHRNQRTRPKRARVSSQVLFPIAPVYQRQLKSAFTARKRTAATHNNNKYRAETKLLILDHLIDSKHVTRIFCNSGPITLQIPLQSSLTQQIQRRLPFLRISLTPAKRCKFITQPLHRSTYSVPITYPATFQEKTTHTLLYKKSKALNCVTANLHFCALYLILLQICTLHIGN
jgi:hypothetical protein